MMEESGPSKKVSSITSPPLKTRITHVNKEREKVSPVNSFLNVEPGYLKSS